MGRLHANRSTNSKRRLHLARGKIQCRNTSLFQLDRSFIASTDWRSDNRRDCSGSDSELWRLSADQLFRCWTGSNSFASLHGYGTFSDHNADSFDPYACACWVDFDVYGKWMGKHC